jgi:transposase-like protein
VTLLAERWYPWYGLSYRQVEDLLAERGIEVNHITVFGDECGERHRRIGRHGANPTHSGVNRFLGQAYHCLRTC